MPKGPLRQAVETAANENFTPAGGPGWWDRVKARWVEYGELEAEFRAHATLAELRASPPSGVEHVIYALFGSKTIRDAMLVRTGKKDGQSISEVLAQAIAAVAGSSSIQEISEIFGTILTEPIIAVLEKYAGTEDKDAKEFYRGLHGVGATVNVFGALVDLAVEIATGGQFEAGAVMADNINRAAGLHLLNWSAITPLLDAGLKPPMERYYNKLYRPMRFSASDLRDLYALGKISAADMREAARSVGWRDIDIDNWIELAFRTLSQGDIWKALHDGLITEEDAVRRLRILGYDPDDIPLLFKLNPKEEEDTAKSFTVSTARAAYRNNLISSGELRAALKELKYQDREIELIIQLEDLNKVQDAKTLALGQIKAAWTENVITDPEAAMWLGRNGFGDEEIRLILETWKAELIPPYRKLNAGTITAAYVEGIIDRGTAKTKLQDVGLVSEDAELELKLVEARNPAVFSGEGAVALRNLTPGILSDLFTAGVISLDELRARLTKLGYTPQDANLLVEAARVRTLPVERRLPQNSIERGYLAGVLDRAGAMGALRALGFTEVNATTILDTLEAENPGIFGGTPALRSKQLTAGVLEDLVVANLITPETMGVRLLELGYSEIDAVLLVERAIQLAAPPVRVLGPGVVQAAYLAGVLDRTQAKERLQAIDLTPEDAEIVLATLERQHPEVFNPSQVTSTRLPSITALAAAVQNDILTEAEFFARAVELGYSAPDAAVYLALATRQERKSTVSLSPSQLVNAYGAGLMSWGEALGRLVQRGYSDPDAILLLRMEKDAIQNTDVWSQLLQGALGPFDALSQLLDGHYNDQDILNAFTELGPGTLGAMGIDLGTLTDFLAGTPGGQ